jgi:hypothetical protein
LVPRSCLQRSRRCVCVCVCVCARVCVCACVCVFVQTSSGDQISQEMSSLNTLSLSHFLFVSAQLHKTLRTSWNPYRQGKAKRLKSQRTNKVSKSLFPTRSHRRRPPSILKFVSYHHDLFYIRCGRCSGGEGGFPAYFHVSLQKSLVLTSLFCLSAHDCAHTQNSSPEKPMLPPSAF